ncbi:MAG: sigma-70 family RNA polymerase sigma factor [Acidimicrobiales bacterium]
MEAGTHTDPVVVQGADEEGIRAPEAVPDWESVARIHGHFIYTVAFRLTGNAHDAEDLVQEALLKVRRGLGTYRPGSLQAWLGRITTNAFLDGVRRRSRRPESPLPENPDRILPASAAADEAMAAGSLSDEIQKALLCLSEEFRVAVVLCDVGGLSYEEISHATGVAIGTVRSRIHRGRAALREVLG